MPTLRKPTVADVPAMMALMSPHIMAERLLPRSSRQVVERLRDYVVAADGDTVVGVASCALVDFELAEVGALAAADQDLAAQLLATVLDEARALGAQRAFVLTDDPSLYEAVGFELTSLDALPEKRDRQCMHCPRLPWCRQVALARRLEDPTAWAAK